MNVDITMGNPVLFAIGMAGSATAVIGATVAAWQNGGSSAGETAFIVSITGIVTAVMSYLGSYFKTWMDNKKADRELKVKFELESQKIRTEFELAKQREEQKAREHEYEAKRESERLEMESRERRHDFENKINALNLRYEWIKMQYAWQNKVIDANKSNVELLEDYNRTLSTELAKFHPDMKVVPMPELSKIPEPPPAPPDLPPITTRISEEPPTMYRATESGELAIPDIHNE